MTTQLCSPPSLRSNLLTLRVHKSAPGTRKLIHQTFATGSSPSVAVRDVPSERLKASLLNAVSTTGRGLQVESHKAADISEMVSKLESACPSLNVTQAASRLDGCWNLAYTANSELIVFLGLGRVPGIQVGAIVQEIDSIAGTFVNQVTISSPFASRAVSVSASFQLDTARRLRLRFEQGALAQPTFNTAASLSSILNLGALRSLDQPLQQSASRLNNALESVPGLPLPVFPAETWLLNTYLDEDLRISRGDGGGLFILMRQAGLPYPSRAYTS
ncbi:hypothetical protein WJX84_003929 [Apatococcus fuscideae]|uniref:Plastid lipid-associated protein/fibrillin conserved domain-containing protein n=1 Tax=Apatococcus fuscideae TaxID=2026836 RepID=A0AAW1T2G0_9CHLO